MTDSSSADATFEQSLAELQDIVRQLEDGSLGLGDAMQQFEKGVKLLRSCYGMLDAAEQKIELLTGFDRDGNPLTTDFSASATEPASNQPGRRSTEQPDDDSRALF